MSDSEPDEHDTSEEVVSASDSDSEEDTSESSSDESEADNAADNAGPGVWMRIMGEDAGPPPVPFTANPGPDWVHLPNTTATPLQYLQVFLTDTIIDLIVDETNRYADQWVESHQEYLRQKPRSRVHAWIKQGHTTRDEMKAFFAVVMNMGIIKKPTISSYWNVSDKSQSTPWFVQHFNRDRYQLLLKFLHFADNTQAPPQDDPAFKLYKVQPIIDHMKEKFLSKYKLHQNVAIDESMVGYRGKTPHLRQYMPNKHHSRFGINLWCVCDSQTHYTANFEVFKGFHDHDNVTAEEGATYALVQRLMRETDLLHQGYHLGCDNYFSSPKLFLDLFHQQTTATGTVRSNRKGLPKQMLKEKLRKGEVGERRRGPLLCVAYKDNNKRPVLLSTQANAGFQQTRNSKGKEMVKPRSVVTYNSVMGGVDASDARLYAYLSERRTIKWTLKLVFALVGRAVLNSYLIYNEHYNGGNKLNRLQFTINALEHLMGTYEPGKVPHKRRSKTQIAAAAEGHEDRAIAPPEHEYVAAPPACKLQKIGNGIRRQCMHHMAKNKKTVWKCAHCDVSMCPECFLPYHKARKLPVLVL